MSVAILISRFVEKYLDEIKSDLTIKCKLTDTKYQEEIVYKITDRVIHVPFAYAIEKLQIVPDKIDRYAKLFSPGTIVNNTSQLRRNQIDVYERATEILYRRGSCILALHCGFGKSVTALHLAVRLGFRTCIVVTKLILVEQWKESIRTFFPTMTVTTISSNGCDGDINSDFCIVNAINVCKYRSSFWKSIGTLIVDELHNVITPVLSKGLLYLTPKYVLGLSATPSRYDEFDRVIPLFFGSESIAKPLDHSHRVYVVKTLFVPDIKTTFNGKLDWNAVLTSQAMDISRNRLIVDTILSFPRTRVWIVLVKRVLHATMLEKLFAEKSVDVTLLTGSKIVFDRSCNILIGTCSKIGVGFDHAAVDSLCIAADVERYFVQFIGRCMRRIDVKPIIVDFVDSFHPLQKHFAVRRKEYEKVGGEIYTCTNDASFQ